MIERDSLDKNERKKTQITRVRMRETQTQRTRMREKNKLREQE